MKKETRVTTSGRAPHEYHGAVNPPVYHASTFLFETLADFERAQKDEAKHLIYARIGTPATRAFEAGFAELDGADHAIATSSGLAAIVVSLMGMLSKGDHLLATDSIYGSMRQFCDAEFTRYGVEVTYYDPLIGAGIASLIKPNTKMVYCESPGSLTFEMQDIPAIVKAAHAKGVVVAMDNTWATPLYLCAADLGVDITIHSCSKYIGGHSDLVMGMLTCSKKYYPQLRRIFCNLGAGVGADEVFLAGRGLRTLAARLKQHQETGLALAHWFAKRPEVVKVLHPALPDCPGHAFWKRDFSGSTGLFSVLLKPYPRAAVAALLEGMELFGLGVSWGGYESLMIPFKPHRTATPSWPHDGLCLRLHAGLEHVDDLIADLEAGLKRLNK
jgi:cysteine-S-conjugate beta-lyase